MPYVKLSDAVERLRFITKNPLACVKRRMHRFVACVPHKTLTNRFNVIACSPDLGELLVETLSVEVVRFIERNSFDVPQDEPFHLVAARYCQAKDEAEAILEFEKYYAKHQLAKQGAQTNYVE